MRTRSVLTAVCTLSLGTNVHDSFWQIVQSHVPSVMVLKTV